MKKGVTNYHKQIYSYTNNWIVELVYCSIMPNNWIAPVDWMDDYHFTLSGIGIL
ncbi:hypothetical protein [Paenibacillus dendrobii]|uniref:hypothetical protein n=1 Tax=Paenibacillus dendrobii TaxID=2691084 RepID=UPI001F1A8BA5|nr:hypothetical protein [Paenibacillus dendrobii]